LDQQTLANYLDLANHHAEATPLQIKALCQAVQQYGFHAAFVNPAYVSLARGLLLQGKIGTVIAFPLGQEITDLKVLASATAVRQGADELDVSMNVGLFKAGEQEAVLAEMKTIVEAAKSERSSTIVKFIIETGFLTNEEIKDASLLVLQSRADFVKTCSGMGPRGATLQDVKLIKEVIGGQLKIKVAGGIDTLKEATDFITAGADRIGTSRAVEIINEYQRTI
jgi:deoxyribose-phosphate aldolase